MPRHRRCCSRLRTRPNSNEHELSSGAVIEIAPVTFERVVDRRQARMFEERVCHAASAGPLGLAPAAEDQAADGEAEAERADREGADRDRLARGREPLPAAERLLLLGRQRFSTALLPQRSARPQSEVELVE